MSKRDRPTVTGQSDPSTAAVLDPELCVEIIRSDGRREKISIPDAIAVYERRAEEAKEELTHCEERIDELRRKWNRSLKGRVLRSGTSVAGTQADAGEIHACSMCGTLENLVEDKNMEGVFQCEDCLARVAKQNQSIEDGMDEEPPVEY